MSRRLTHTTNKTKITLKKYQQKNIEEGFKPNGFWYSIDGDWEEWLRGEDWLDRLGNQEFKFELNYKSIYVIEDMKDLLHLDKEYGFNLIPESPTSDIRQIDWVKLAKDYNGIEFRNYRSMRSAVMWGNTEERLYIKLLWFTAIDCESGCIWNMFPEVKNVAHVGSTKQAKEFKNN